LEGLKGNVPRSGIVYFCLVFIRNLFFYTGIALVITTAFQPHREWVSAETESSIQNPLQQDTATYKEDFEASAKGSYAPGDLDLTNGSWHLNNAMIGSAVADLKHGSRSVRMKTGSIAMNFDLQHIQQVYISHGVYGQDRASTWKLMLSVDGGKNYSQVGAAITEKNHTLVTDTFSVKPFYKMRFRIENIGSNAAARINLDDITFVKVEPAVSTSDSSKLADLTAPTAGHTGTATLSGKTRGLVYDVDIQPEKGDNSNMLFGNPSRASSTTPENYYLDLKYYTQSYSRSKAIPNWVSWHLDATTTTRIADRMDNFAGFSELPPEFFVVTSSSYVGSGFDRGHNCPSADRSSSKAANSATFLMTNMVPQAPRNNQRTWANFESYLRSLVDAGNEIYIIMGNYGTGGIGSKGPATTIANGNIAVPAHLWKVALILPQGNKDLSRVNANTRIIAISTANVNTIDPDWRKYLVTVNDIEKATGYDLLTALPERLQTILEQRKDNGY